MYPDYQQKTAQADGNSVIVWSLQGRCVKLESVLTGMTYFQLTVSQW